MKKINPKGFSETLGALSVQLGEIALDKWLSKVSDDEILKQVPVINFILSLVRATLSIRDRLYLEKIRAFCESRDEHTREECENFARKLEADPKERQRVAEAILLLLDQFDDMEKTVLFARAFSAFVRGEIESSYYFRRYGEIIKAANVMHLKNFYLTVEEAEAGRDKRPIQTFAADQVLPLSSLGLVEIMPGQASVGSQQGIMVSFVCTDFGKRFVKIVIHKDDIDESED